MSIIPESVSRKIKCCLKASGVVEHFADDAILLPCSGTACRKCVQNSYLVELECIFCANKHNKNEVLKMRSNPVVKGFIEAYINELSADLRLKLKETARLFQDESLKSEISTRFSHIEHEIEARVEIIVNELHRHRDELKNELEKIKEKYEKSVLSDEVMIATRLKLDNATLASTEDSNYENFMKTQMLIKESHDSLQTLLHQIKETQFTTSVTNSSVTKDLIGEIVTPCWSIIVNESRIELSDIDCRGIAYLKTQNKLITSDYESDSLYVIDVTDPSAAHQRYTHEYIKKPDAICIGRHNTLFVKQSPRHVLVFQIFNENELSYQRRFQMKSKEGENSIIKVDLTDTNDHLFELNIQSSLITVLNSSTGVVIKEIKIEEPRNMDFSERSIYVSSNSKKSNCVFILNKSTYEIVNKIIMIETCMLLDSVLLDNNRNSVIIISRVANEKFVNVFGKNGTLTHKMEIINNKTDSEELVDFILMDKAIAWLYKKWIKVVTFE